MQVTASKMMVIAQFAHQSPAKLVIAMNAKNAIRAAQPASPANDIPSPIVLPPAHASARAAMGLWLGGDISGS